MTQSVKKDFKTNFNENEHQLFQVGDLARIFGKSVRALRLYEEKGLLKPASRTQGGFRLYDENSIIRLKWIIQMQRLGFTLAQIAAISEKLDKADTAPEAMIEMRELFIRKHKDIQSKLKDLTELSDELQSALDYLSICDNCNTSASFVECCPTRMFRKEIAGDKLPNILAGLYAPYLTNVLTNQKEIEEVKK